MEIIDAGAVPETPEPAVEEARAADLPPLLVSPPWTWEPVVREGLEAPEVPVSVSWDDYQRRRLADEGRARGRKDADWEAAAERFRTGRALTELTSKGRGPLYTGLLLHGPERLARELLDDRRYWDEFDDLQALGGIIVRHEVRAYPLAVRVAAKGEPGSADLLVPFLGAEAAELMIGIPPDRHGRRPTGTSWARRHGAGAVPLLLPHALGAPGPRREGAEELLRQVVTWHGHEAAARAAHPFGPEAVRAMEMLRYPASVPPADGDRAPERLPRILLRGRGRALPADATRHFTTLLLLSRPGRPHSFVEEVIELCDPRSLAEFAWALYRVAPTDRHNWIPDGFQFALGRLGDDETARRVRDVINGWEPWWPGGQAALNALKVFVAMGTDAAFRTLHGIVEKPHPAKHVQRYGDYALHLAAKTRGLTVERLIDRLVPDFGLDSDGGMDLDYGPRSFRVGFDERLVPYVVDGAGKLRKTLPKPGPKDDAALAGPAHRRFTELKQGVREVAAKQRDRLHEAMLSGREWPLEEFRALYVEHPLLRELARRLVWRAAQDGTATAFRIAEDRTLADVDDKEFVPPPDARIALPHPILLGDALDAWREVFADYEIAQPFAQLDRPVRRLGEADRASLRLPGFGGADVPVAALNRLARGTWSLRTAPEHYGKRALLTYPAGRDTRVEVRFEPGIPKHRTAPDPPQRITEVEYVRDGDSRHGREPLPFGDLDPVIASEFLADLTELTRNQET
ncbi:DUF4132 domain-containing protein [Actinomadura sp. 21ATH]|uniref:DUF4132 domain-containing protein n=1 Tax=Actinomadura sp. 21ATH TaxID=1735444 RepID=UPI0035BEC812